MDQNNKKKIPLFDVTDEKLKQVLVGVFMLREMNLELIRMYEKESELKKAHKAYLHVREEADQMCKRNKVLVRQIADALVSPHQVKLPKGAITDPIFVSIMQGLDMELPEDEEEQFDSEKCRGCLRYDDCEEYFMQIRASKKKEKNKVADNFDPQAGMVMMSTDTLGTMQDDMLQMTESLEKVADLLKNGASGRTILKEDARKVADQCANLSHEVFQRWDNADFVALA